MKGKAAVGIHFLKSKTLTPIRLKGIRLEGDSEQSAKIEAGLVYLPRQADWLEAFKLEMLAFPCGRYDDQVHSMSQLLGWYSNRATLPGIGRFLELKE